MNLGNIDEGKRAMNQLAINTIGDELEAAAAFCRSEQLGLEITDFAFPSILDENVNTRIDRHKEALAGISLISSHGPFFEMIAASRDKAIVSVVRDRHSAALTASIEIGAVYYVAHTNFNPLIRDPSYRKGWTERTLEFWLPFADKAGKENVTICLENVWEPVPDIQAELIAAGNHPHLRATFDNGHVLVFSRIPAVKWIETLGPALAHCHLHDNFGERDEHNAVGQGNEDWPELITALKRHSLSAVLVAESDRFEHNKLSIERLRNFINSI
jgi:sugar phosphate isomerase/epimerase